MLFKFACHVQLWQLMKWFIHVYVISEVWIQINAFSIYLKERRVLHSSNRFFYSRLILPLYSYYLHKLYLFQLFLSCITNGIICGFQYTSIKNSLNIPRRHVIWKRLFSRIEHKQILDSGYYWFRNLEYKNYNLLSCHMY